MTAGVTEIIEYEDYKSLPDSELYKLICDKLYIDEATNGGEFKSKKSAEYLERAIYYCPDCGGFGELYSKGQITTCKKCGLSVKYLPSKELLGVNKEFKYRFISEWYEEQEKFIRSLDFSKYNEAPITSDKVDFYEVIPCKKKILIKEGATVLAFGDRFEIKLGSSVDTFFYKDITASGVIGRNKMNFYSQKRIFQIRSDEHFNALKYVNIYYQSENILKGDTENGFLGI